MPSNKVRTRFAPSPTGYMHVGNLRTALYTYLMAKHEDGTFILRIEDTDQGRYVEGAVDVIYNTLRETGLLWDEGPDIGGPVGPYVQSERMGMFKQYAEQLVAEGKAYYCFCTKERLESIHQDGEFGAAKTGAAMLAIRTGVPILPVYITPERKLFQRTKVYIGEPYMPFTEKRRANAEDYERVTEDIMEHIRAIRDTRAEREVQG